MILQYKPLFSEEDKKAVSDYMYQGGWVTEFKETRDFEARLANFLGVKYCHITANGTISLSLALLAGGIKPGDRVIVPNLTMIATANAVRLIGAIPVLIDVDKETLTLSPEKTEEYLKNNKVSALIYVTLNGRGNHSNFFYRLCKDKGIFYVSDDAQSLGSKNESGEALGSIASISSFSFSMPKIITTGQGGCLVTNNPFLSKKIDELRDFGRLKSGVDIHPSFGINCKFTDLQAVLGVSQLKSIGIRIQQKKQIYSSYKVLLSSIDEVSFIQTKDNVTPWFVDIFVEKKEKLMSFLKENGILTRTVYPPIHTQVDYCITNTLNYDNSVLASERGLWLPSSMDLTFNDIELICNKIKEFYENNKN